MLGFSQCSKAEILWFDTLQDLSDFSHLPEAETLWLDALQDVLGFACFS
jgi:hypothetical protein